ncbi:hypothetical protein BDV12DRAFT_208399 [Aspergillus spectabilis]
MPLMYNGNSRSSDEIPVWDLKSTTSRPPEDVQHLPYHTGPQTHNDVERDDRQRVNRRDILPGGKYRAIAKLFLRYDDSDRNSWVTATGFLVRDDTVATAGHCVYDWQEQLGRLSEVKVYIGYTGKHNVDNAEVEFRHGKRVATTPEWMEKGGRREADLAFIKLNKPFNEVTPIQYRDTPESDKGVIGVVGYSTDLEDHGETGGQLYECFVEAKWDLSRSQVLEYQVDAWGGNAGSPVFDKDDMDCIGVHTHGGARKNCATAIGKFGFDFEAYFDALDERSEHQRRQPQYRERSEEQDLVGEILKLVKDFPNQIPRDVLSTESRLSFGEIGVPAGAVAHIALSAATKAVIEDVQTSDSRFEKDRAFDGVAERAVFAEAALQAVQQMSPELRQSEHIFDTITKTVTNLLPTIQETGSTVINSAQDPLLRLALDEIRKAKTRTGRTENLPSLRPSKGRNNLSNKKASFVEAVSDVRDDRTQRFINNIASEAVCDDAEVNWDNLELPRRLSSARSIMEGGKQQPSMVGPLLAAKRQQKRQEIGLHNLQHLTEMDMEQDEFPLSVECLPLRAVVSEAALQAILRIPQDELEQEGLIDVMRDVIRDHGPTIMKIAPLVIRKVAPVFAAIASEEVFGREYRKEREYAKGYGREYSKYGKAGGGKYSLTTKTKSMAKGKPVSPAEREFLIQAFR